MPHSIIFKLPGEHQDMRCQMPQCTELQQGWNLSVGVMTDAEFYECCFCCRFSGPDDHVFVYFTDHGGPGIIAFPNSEVTTTITIMFICMSLV